MHAGGWTRCVADAVVCLTVLPVPARLDNDVGTGVHLTPTGIEFDERRLTLGNSTEVRGGGGTSAACTRELFTCAYYAGRHHWIENA